MVAVQVTTDVRYAEATALLQEFVHREIPGKGPRKLVQPDDDLVRSGILDSLAFVKLLAFIEETFGVRFEDDELNPENFRTIGAICSRLHSR